MGGLVLKLSPRERVLVNGAVIENGERRSRISIVTPDAKVLRLKDAVHPEDANTPVRRACYRIQLVLSGDLDGAAEKAHLLCRIEELSQVFTDRDSQKHTKTATDALIHEDFYQALRALRLLMPREDRLLMLRKGSSVN